jgi:hypothetical protein
MLVQASASAYAVPSIVVPASSTTGRSCTTETRHQALDPAPASGATAGTKRIAFPLAIAFAFWRNCRRLPCTVRFAAGSSSAASPPRVSVTVPNENAKSTPVVSASEWTTCATCSEDASVEASSDAPPRRPPWQRPADACSIVPPAPSAHSEPAGP